MERSTRELVLFLAVGVAVLGAVIIVPQVRARKTQALREEIRHANRFNGPPPGMRYITAGPVIRGDDEKSLARKTQRGYPPLGEIHPFESPQRRIFVKALFLDTHEVSNKAYRAAVDAGKVTPPASNASATRDDYYTNPKYDDYPVVDITWQQASDYCACRDKRLPTEAEWERAARGLDDRWWPWGDVWDPARANGADARSGDTAQVGQYAHDVSPARIYDMAGNVREFVADWFAEETYEQDSAYAPTGPSRGDLHVVRGGTWADSAWDLRTGKRDALSPEAHDQRTGFRCARDFVPDWRAELDQVLKSSTTQPALSAKIDAAKGRLRVDHRAYDYGEIWVGDPVEHTFTLQNVGEGELNIRGVRTSCGCTTVGETEASIAPGKTWDLTVKINTDSGKRGLLNRSVHLVTDDPYEAYYDLYLYGIVRNYVELDPSFCVRFGTMNGATDLERKVRVINNLDTSMKIISLDLGEAAQRWLEVAVEPVVDGKAYDLTVRAKPGLEHGHYENRITILTNLEKAPKVNVLAIGEVLPRVAVRPKVLSIEQPVILAKRRVMLQVNEGGPVRIISAKMNDPSIKTNIGRVNDVSFVEVQLKPGATIPQEGYELVITTDDDEFSEFRVPVYRRSGSSAPLQGKSIRPGAK